MSCARLVVLTLVAILSVGCGGGDDEEAGYYANYLERMASQLGALPAADEPALLAYPSQRQLSLEIERQVIDVTQFARVHACDLGDLVGERNGALGRVAGPVALLMQDQRWLRAGPGCVDQGQDWLAAVLTAKRRSLPARFWNATLAGDEFAQLMSTASRIGDPQADDLLAPDVGLRDLLDQHQALASLTVTAQPLNAALQSLTQGQSMGKMRQRWRLLRLNLGRVSRGLTRDSQRICRNGKPTPKSKILRQVFDIHYVNDLQPRFAQHYGADQASVLALSALQQRLQSVAPEPFLRWYQATLNPENSDGEWQRTQAALRAHALAWQQLWTQCGMPLAPLAPSSAAAQD